MDQATIQRYQSGGDIYASLAAQHGAAVANAAASAALSGDETQVNAAIAAAQFGSNLDSSTLDIFGNEIYNAPLQAPIEQAATIATNAITSAGNAAKKVTFAGLGNWGVWIIGGIVVIGLFLYFGGASVVRSQIAKRA